MLIFGLMLLLKTAACVEFNCSFHQSVPCSAVLGEKLILQLLVSDASKYDLKIQKRIYDTEHDPVCKIKNDRIKKDECDLFNNRHGEVSVNNGILIINTVIRADSGNYRLQVFDSHGTETFKADLQVIVKGTETVVPIVLGCLAVVLIFLVIIAYYFYKKKNQLKPTQNVSEIVNEHDAQKKLLREEEQKKTDVQYATVNAQNKRKREKEELHYGEVTFSSSSAQRPRQQEECVYSEVHTR